MTAYLSLFGVSFLAATLIPFYSEVALVGLLAAGYDPFLLWLFASAGNTLGAVVNWVLGRYLLHFEHRRWFPFPILKIASLPALVPAFRRLVIIVVLVAGGRAML